MKPNKKHVLEILNNPDNHDKLLDGWDKYVIITQFQEFYPEFADYIPWEIEEVSVERNRQGHWQFYFYGEENGEPQKYWLSHRRLGQSPATAKRQRVIQAARHHIKHQTDAFHDESKCKHTTPYGRNVWRWFCNNCDKRLRRRHAEVDHETPTFMELLNDWLGKNKYTYDTLPLIEDKEGHVNYGFRTGDALNWAQYHYDNAKLQILCSDCHWEKTTEHVEPFRRINADAQSA